MALASMFELSVCSFSSQSLFSPFSPMVQSAVWSLNLAHLACLFLKMSCLFWDIKSPHPLKSTGCQQNVLAIKPPMFFLCLSKLYLQTCKCFWFHSKTILQCTGCNVFIQDNTNIHNMEFKKKKKVCTLPCMCLSCYLLTSANSISIGSGHLGQ